MIRSVEELYCKRGWGVNSSEDARHCSVLYICKYFVIRSIAAYFAPGSLIVRGGLGGGARLIRRPYHLL